MNEAGDPPFRPPAERRGWPAIVWIAAILAAVVGLVFLWQPPSSPEAAAAMAMPSMPSLPDPAAPSNASSSEDAGSAIPATAASGTELIEVCGVGWVPPDALGGADLAAVAGDRDVVASQRRLLDGLRSDGESGRAVALSLAMHGAGRADVKGDLSLLASASDACKEPECAISNEERELVATSREELAKMASSTRDPAVYALALQACRPSSKAGSCALLNVDQWALIDEGNAAPWLAILQRALQRKDAAGVDEALFRIGAASQLNERIGFAAGRVAEKAGTSETDLIAAQLLALDAHLQSTSAALSFGAASVSQACTTATFADANRRQVCDAAAATLADRSDTLLDVNVGAAIGRRLGWPDDRIDALKALQLATVAMARQREVYVDRDRTLDLSVSCEGSRRMLAMFKRQGRGGEVQPIRDWLAENGRSIAPYAREAHELRLRSQEEAEARRAAAQDTPAPASAVTAAAAGSVASDAASAPVAVAVVPAPTASAAPPSASLADAAAASATPYSATPPPDR